MNLLEKTKNLCSTKGIILIALSLLIVLSGIGMSLAYFTSSEKADGLIFSFSKLETLISVDGSDYESEIDLSTTSLTAGTELVNNANVKISADSIGGFMRVKVGYNGTTTNSQNVAVALNSDKVYNTYVGSTYQWEYIDGYYYLVNTSGKLLECSAGTGYTLFEGSDTVIFPDINKYNLEVTDLTNVSFSIVAESV
ncbi:MAG: hypothetical protein IJZ29_00265, partial [Clostridia bacterium]|nr:hypothetical protein [Clostridia bacterium]